MPKSKRWVASGLVFFLLALAGACGGDDEAANTGNQSPSAVGSNNGSVQVINLEQSASALTDLQSFRFKLALKIDVGADLANEGEGDLGGALSALLLGALTDLKAEGAFVSPDRLEIIATFGGEEISLVQIGSQSWMKFAGVWQESQAVSESFDLSEGIPTDLLSDVVPQELLESAQATTEEIGGISTTRYSFNKAALLAAAELSGETSGLSDLKDASLDLWLTADGLPLKIVLIASGNDDSGQEMSIEFELLLSDFNDAAIDIKPPV